jgi:hypothetical protein
MLFSSKALIFAVIGIAFFTFIVAFMRATVYMLGESQNPRWDELRTSAIVGTVALGIGLGSPLAGWLSGRKVELGLVPLGALGMMAGCIFAAFSLDYIPGLVGFIILIGFSTGFYLVPLFTLLQHRSPKTSKGDMIATSNFINVTGAIGASALFFLLVFLAEKTELTEPIPVESDCAHGRLTKLETLRGRPRYFEVTEGDSVYPGGRKPNPDAVPNAFEQIFGRNRPRRGPPIVVHVDRHVELGSEVIVSRYDLRGVEHLDVRGRGDPLTVEYDRHHLPRFLFIAAGLMTLGTLVVLRRRMPDLFRRSGWVVRGQFGRPIILSGIHHVPGVGPTVLATGSADPDLQAVIRSAADRSTSFFDGDPKQLDAAAAVLRAGDIVAVVVDAAKGVEFLKLLGGLMPIDIVPVFANKEQDTLMVRFGPKLEAGTPLEELRTKIAAARFAEE